MSGPLLLTIVPHETSKFIALSQKAIDKYGDMDSFTPCDSCEINDGSEAEDLSFRVIRSRTTRGIHGRKITLIHQCHSFLRLTLMKLSQLITASRQHSAMLMALKVVLCFEPCFDWEGHGRHR
jgi:hypothetical protein